MASQGWSLLILNGSRFWGSFFMVCSLFVCFSSAQAADTEVQKPLPSSGSKETVEMDPSKPVESVETMHLRGELGSLLDMQKKMAEQIESLKARIEVNENRTNRIGHKLMTGSRTVQANNAMMDSLLRRVRVSGYVETGWRMFNHAPNTPEYLDAKETAKSGNTFDMRRAVLRYNTQFTDKASWIGEVEYEDAGRDEISLEQSEFIYNHRPWLNMRAGLIVPTLSQINVNHDGTMRYLVDRPMVDTFVVPSTYRDLGVGIWGYVPILKASAVDYEVNVFNGLTDIMSEPLTSGAAVSANPFFSGLHDAKINESGNGDHLLDNNRNKAIHARIGFMPFPGLQIGGGGYFSRYNVNSQKNLELYTADLRYRYKRLSFLGEYAVALFQRGGGHNRQGIAFSQFPSGLSGYHLEGVYDITPKLSGVVAWQHVVLDIGRHGTGMSRFSIGGRYNLFARVYLKGEYQITTPQRQFASEKVNHGILTQLTFDL